MSMPNIMHTADESVTPVTDGNATRAKPMIARVDPAYRIHSTRR